MAGIIRTDTLTNSNTSNLITQANTTTITIGASGQTVALASGATSSGFGATYNGAVNWSSTVQTTGFTAVSGNGYFCNTTSAAFTVTLPATPSAGAIVAIADYAGTASTNNITVGRNGSNINGSASNFIINVSNSSITFVYVDVTAGWKLVYSASVSDVQTPQYVAATGGTVTTCGNYKIHTFNSSGCFVVSNAGNPLGSTTVDYMVVAGGGSGGKDVGGGGGAGGFRESVPTTAAWTASPLANPGGALPISATTYPVTVGGGGASAIPSNAGSPSVFSTITAAGGGRGGCYSGCNGGNGGSGGGGGGYTVATTGGTGNTPPVSPPQGNNGGSNIAPLGINKTGGGGGGAGSAGSNAVSAPTGFTPRSSGVSTSISGSPVTFSQGGRGAGDCAPGATAGGSNTGTGGDGEGSAAPSSGGAAGGSGKIVIRYKFQ